MVAAIIFISLGLLLFAQEQVFGQGKKAEEQSLRPEETAPPPVKEEAVPATTQGKAQEKAGSALGSQGPEASGRGEAEEEPETAPAVQPGNVTVNFKGADIKTVLAYISEVAGVDIVPAPDVKGTIDLKLTNKPWNTALDIILRNYGFAYERDGDIIRVVTIDKLKQEELTTQAFNLNYSKSKDVVTSIKDVVSERGKVTHDERTNTVLVTDIPTNIYKIGQVVERLDKKTDQVLIEARVIETTLDDTEKLGIDWNVKFSVSGARRPTTIPFDYFKMPFNAEQEKTNIYFPQVLTASPQSSTAGAGGTVGTTTAGEFPSTGDMLGSFGFPFAGKDLFTFGTLDFSQFNAVLELIKSRSDTDLVSNPRIATLNNNEALINVGDTINLPKYERNSSTGKMEITGYEPKDLGIILKVVPHVNDKKEIVIDLAPQISSLVRYDTLDKASGVVAPVFSTRQAKTQVMIKDGDTIFIGGLITEDIIDTKKKLPFLGDIFGDVPYLGLLFTKKETIKKKKELIFFITVNLMTADRAIEGVPLVNKAYIPKFTVTQEKDLAAKKKRHKKGL